MSFETDCMQSLTIALDRFSGQLESMSFGSGNQIDNSLILKKMDQIIDTIETQGDVELLRSACYLDMINKEYFRDYLVRHYKLSNGDKLEDLESDYKSKQEKGLYNDSKPKQKTLQRNTGLSYQGK